MYQKIIKLFLRLAIATGFLSAVADRFGYWPNDVLVWGNWDSFLEYTQFILPWVPGAMIPAIGIIATVAETIFAIFLLIGFKTELTVKWSGILLLLFALAMASSSGVKVVFDYAVFSACAAAFALGLMREKYMEVDSIMGFSKN
jgi:uncharacterized membrane protein YphA (DoxX/SURF4 family)